MSLRAWLPLNGNLNNQGLENISITSSGATVDASGKIGSCMKLTSYTDLKVYDNINSKSVSFGGWFKFNQSEIATVVQTHTYDSTYPFPTGNILGDDNYGGIGLIWTGNDMKSSQTFTALNMNVCLRTSTVNTATDRVTIPFDTWVHCFLVFDRDAGKLTFYLNGESQGSSATVGSFTDAQTSRKLSLNYNGIYGGNGPAFQIPFRCNDVRVYDHALSQKEVKEISKGLVLHYPLNTLSTTGVNLVSAVTAGGRTTVSNNVVTTTGDDADTYFRLSLSSPIVEGKTYRLSCIGSNIPNGLKWMFPVGSQTNYAYCPFDIKNGYNESIFVANSVAAGSNILMDDYASTSALRANNSVFSNFNLEEVIGVNDCSGYKYDGTPIGNLITNSDTPRYDCSISLSGSEQAIQIPNLSTLLSDGQFTISVWFRKNTGEWSSLAWETLIGGPSGFELETKNSSTNSPLYYAYSWGAGNVSYTLDTWHLATMTRTSDGTLFYLDGVQKFTGTAGSIPSGNYYIGSWKDSSHQNMRGSVSDFRLYATALSATDIKELYETGQSIDNGGNMYCYELKEG